jgi:delta-aminolevulinic acid dehydratase/porphobilinogen synthase
MPGHFTVEIKINNMKQMLGKLPVITIPALILFSCQQTQKKEEAAPAIVKEQPEVLYRM